MKASAYRIATCCPAGMSAELTAYINQPSKNVSNMLTKDVIALDLTGRFQDTDIRFGGAILAWARNEVMNSQDFAQWLNSLSSMRAHGTKEVVAFEASTSKLDLGTIGQGRFYPVDGLTPQAAGELYQKVGFFNKSQAVDERSLFDYRRTLANALNTDAIGIIVAVLAESEELAEMQVRDALALLVPAAESN